VATTFQAMPGHGKLTSVVPEQGELEQERRKTTEDELVEAQQHVTVCLSSEREDSKCEHQPSDNPGKDHHNVHDLHVQSHCLLWSQFAAHGESTAVDLSMERKFAHSKYQHFLGAFRQVSLLMTLGVLALAFNAFMAKQWVRVVILSGVVAPMYLAYGLVAFRYRRQYLNMSGTITEKVLLAILCLHSGVIVSAEWARDILDYGMLVMHIGFICNFTPLSATAIHIVTVVFGLIPYVLLKLLRFMEESPVPAAQASSSLGYLCIRTSGQASLALEILVPAAILVQQTVVTMRRDKSLRVDMLGSEGLRARHRSLEIEKKKCEDILTSMLPRQIIASLKNNEPVEPQFFSDATVIFTEICRFDRLCEQLPPTNVVEVLNIIYLEFDRLSDQLQVYKVETVGQVYMAVVGCPDIILNHADLAAHFALAAQQAMPHVLHRVARLKRPRGLEDSLGLSVRPASSKSESSPESERLLGHIDIPIRVGLNSGKLRAGVVGLDNPRYKLFGDTVNTASRMESTCEPGRVQVSPSTQKKLSPGVFVLESRGKIQVKGKPDMETSFLNGYVDGGSADKRKITVERGDNPGTDEEDLQDKNHCQIERTQNRAITKRITDMVNFGLPAPDHPDSGSASTSDEARPVTPSAATKSKPPNAARNMGKGKSWLADPAPQQQQQQQQKQQPQQQKPQPPQQQPQQQMPQRFLDNEEDSGNHIRSRSGCSRFSRFFLLVPPAQKTVAWMDSLERDLPAFLEDTLQNRISFARNLTLVWLMLITFISGADYGMDVLRDDLQRYRGAILFRVFGNHVIGLVYLLLLTRQDLFREHAQSLTLGMLVCQGAALLGCGMLIHNNEVAIIALYGAYVLLYTVCSIGQRFMICALAVAGFIVIEAFRCDVKAVLDAAQNIGFLVIFLISMA